MKNTTLLLTFLMSILLSSSSYSQALIRLLRVDTSNGHITIKNFGNTSQDITGYRFCARINYTGGSLNNGMVITGDLDLSPNEEVTVQWNTILSSQATNSDLGLYLPSGSFGIAANMVDFTQWGSGGNGRESVAVTKGIWLAGEFIPIDGSAYIFTGTNGTEVFRANWSTENVLSIDEFSFSKQTKIFPNPARKYFTLESPNNLINKLSIIDLTGKTIKQLDNYEGQEIITEDLNSGIYFVKFESNNQIGIKRLIIN